MPGRVFVFSLLVLAHRCLRSEFFRVHLWSLVSNDRKATPERNLTLRYPAETAHLNLLPLCYIGIL